MTTYLLLGANGYIGSHVHEAINQMADSNQVVAVGRHPPRLPLPAHSSWVPLDITRTSVQELVLLIQASRPDALINCVGRTSGSSQELWEVNTTFVEKLLQALHVSGPAPLIHLGSAAEYGIQPQGVAIREDFTTRPVSDYGRSKLAATRKVLHAAESGDVSATVLRVFNAVGARAPSESLPGRAVRELSTALRMKRSSITLGSLSTYRDFVATSDVATAVLLSTKLTSRSPVINVGRGIAMSCRTVVEILADAAGFTGDIIESTGGSSRSNEVPWQQADVSLLAHELHWTPTTSITHALKELWQSSTEATLV